MKTSMFLHTDIIGWGMWLSWLPEESPSSHTATCRNHPQRCHYQARQAQDTLHTQSSLISDNSDVMGAICKGHNLFRF
jgi:hypothetical protein